MMLFLWLKSRQKLTLAIVMIAAAPILIGVMPERWFSRMETINTYEEDTSSMGRINAWETAFNLAKDRPLIGGGFHIYDSRVFAKYSPNPEDVHAAHSIYFAALGEHGWVGLLLFLLCGFSTWRTASWIIRRAKDRPELRRDADLAMMIQVSLIAYSVGGAFLSLLYFDVPYYLMIILVLMRENIENLEKTEKLNLANQTSGRAKASTLAGALPVDARSSDSMARTLKP
jgi:probable O-glycosylation ligase (exosortase A-associated)